MKKFILSQTGWIYVQHISKLQRNWESIFRQKMTHFSSCSCTLVNMPRVVMVGEFGLDFGRLKLFALCLLCAWSCVLLSGMLVVDLSVYKNRSDSLFILFKLPKFSCVWQSINITWRQTEPISRLNLSCSIVAVCSVSSSNHSYACIEHYLLLALSQEMV